MDNSTKIFSKHVKILRNVDCVLVMLFWFGCAGVKIALFIDNVGFYFARIVFRLPAYLWCPWELDAGAV